MAISDFCYFSFFTPKTQNLDFSKIDAFKNQVFGAIKTGIYVVKLHTNNTHTRFQSNIFTFGCAMVKKNIPKGDNVTFLNEIFGISNCRA